MRLCVLDTGESKDLLMRCSTLLFKHRLLRHQLPTAILYHLDTADFERLLRFSLRFTATADGVYMYVYQIQSVLTSLLDDIVQVCHVPSETERSRLLLVV